jgi:hypothetical protein
MQVIDENTVGLYGKNESAAHRFFDDLLDQGFNIPDAVEKTKENFEVADQRFWLWLGDQPIT